MCLANAVAVRDEREGITQGLPIDDQVDERQRRRRVGRERERMRERQPLDDRPLGAEPSAPREAAEVESSDGGRDRRVVEARDAQPAVLIITCLTNV
jgi:hypothetical protein